MPNWIDTVFLLFFLVVVLKSYRAGTFRMVMEVLLFFFSIYLSEKVCQFFVFNAKIFATGNTLAYAGFFLFFFFISYTALKVLFWVLSRVLKVEILGVFDKVLAAAIGILIALLNFGLYLNVALMMPLSIPARDYVQASQVCRFALPVFSRGYTLAFGFVPEMEKLIGKNIDQAMNDSNLSKDLKDNLALPKLKLNLPQLGDGKNLALPKLEIPKKRLRPTLNQTLDDVEKTIR